MNPDEKEEARRHAMARQRERHEFLERHDRLHPSDMPPENMLIVLPSPNWRLQQIEKCIEATTVNECVCQP